MKKELKKPLTKELTNIQAYGNEGCNEKNCIC